MSSLIINSQSGSTEGWIYNEQTAKNLEVYFEWKEGQHGSVVFNENEEIVARMLDNGQLWLVKNGKLHGGSLDKLVVGFTGSNTTRQRTAALVNAQGQLIWKSEQAANLSKLRQLASKGEIKALELLLEKQNKQAFSSIVTTKAEDNTTTKDAATSNTLKTEAENRNKRHDDSLKKSDNRIDDRNYAFQQKMRREQAMQRIQQHRSDG